MFSLYLYFFWFNENITYNNSNALMHLEWTRIRYKTYYILVDVNRYYAITPIDFVRMNDYWEFMQHRNLRVLGRLGKVRLESEFTSGFRPQITRCECFKKMLCDATYNTTRRCFRDYLRYLLIRHDNDPVLVRQVIR